MWMQRIAVAAALTPILMLNWTVGATQDANQASVTARRLVAQPATPKSPFEAIWVGRWKADVEPGEGKALKCETVQVGPHDWMATFNAVCDKDYAFTMTIPGRREGDRVLFEASVDLGEQYGGQYHWTGEVEGDEFRGQYTHAKYNGTFQMTRSADGFIDPGVYCEVPATREPKAD